MKLFIVIVIVLLLNIPFGYWRTNVKNFSLQWFMAVHVPVIFIILFRIYADIGFELYTYPLFILSFFLGQYTGSRIYHRRKHLSNESLTSCFVMDTYRRIK